MARLSAGLVKKIAPLRCRQTVMQLAGGGLLQQIDLAREY
jgi:hypothetical protein